MHGLAIPASPSTSPFLQLFAKQELSMMGFINIQNMALYFVLYLSHLCWLILHKKFRYRRDLSDHSLSYSLKGLVQNQEHYWSVYKGSLHGRRPWGKLWVFFGGWRILGEGSLISLKIMLLIFCIMVRDLSTDFLSSLQEVVSVVLTILSFNFTWCIDVRGWTVRGLTFYLSDLFPKPISLLRVQLLL